MQKNLGLPTNEMKEVQPVVEGSYSEEIPPNGLNDLRISELAYQSVFMFQPEISKTLPNAEE